MITFVIFVVAFRYATQALTLTEEVDLFIRNVVMTLLAYKVTSSILKIFDAVVKSHIVPYAERTSILDTTVIPTIERIVKWTVWAVVILLIISNLGYNISSLIAGLGLGGLAVALAAQQALSNFFGSISLFADKTFKVGDFIRATGVEGTVTAVGLRSTRLETREGTELIIPNSQLSIQTVENLSRRPKRRVEIILNLDYKTSSAQVKKALELLKSIVETHDETDGKSRVHFNAFGDKGLTVTVTYWIKTVDLEKGQLVQNEVNTEILSAFEKAKISIVPGSAPVTSTTK